MHSNTIQQFNDSIQNFESYPANLLSNHGLAFNTEAYVKALEMHKDRLFCSEENRSCNLRMWDCDRQMDGFNEISSKSLSDLQSSLQEKYHDPMSRFVFITAPNSRSALNVSRRMAQFLFSWHQVMPSYLDFLVTFGNRHYEKEFPFTGFRQQLRISDTLRGGMINELGRSGKDFSLCFNLRSVEQSADNWPWALRQTAVYHSFDFFSGRATWIITKANKLIEKRIRSATTARGSPEISQLDTNSHAFSASLLTYIIFIDWAGENWRWYIDYLEEQAQKLTGPVLQMSVPRPQYPTPTSPISPQEPPTRKSTRSFSWKLSSIMSEKTLTDDAQSSSPHLHCNMHGKHQPSSFVPTFDHFIAAEEKGFRIDDLQENQFLEDKTNEAMLIIDANLNILNELARSYKSILNSADCPEEIKSRCLPHFERMECRIEAVKSDLRMQLSRAKSIIRLLADRKSLLSSILEFQNMQASRFLAEKAQTSAEEMKAMTGDMHDIARKTKQETVSMRIITLVTLFFLPGTFISTLMSTDIVRWQSESSEELRRTVSIGALQFFMSVTIPLMLLTFLAWYVVYRCLRRKDRAFHQSLDPESQMRPHVRQNTGPC